jgi:hypothetical protein
MLGQRSAVEARAGLFHLSQCDGAQATVARAVALPVTAQDCAAAMLVRSVAPHAFPRVVVLGARSCSDVREPLERLTWHRTDHDVATDDEALGRADIVKRREVRVDVE